MTRPDAVAAANCCDANVAGNYYPKYSTKNPISRALVGGFLNSFRDLLALTQAREVIEVGCGEGYLSLLMAESGRHVRGIDISPDIITLAKRNAEVAGQAIRFEARSVYDLDPARDSAELVVCCEVLEHVEDPERALRILATLAKPYVIVSVPREPIWRCLNVLRGKYLSDFGNTPGHIQHWSRRGFLELLDRHLDILEVRAPLPWTMALCRAR